MQKLKLYGIGNQGTYNYLIVDFRPDFLKWFDAVVRLAKFPMDIDFEYLAAKPGKKMRPLKDTHMSYYDEGKKDGLRIDLFFGKKKVFIVLISTPAERKRFMNAVLGLTDS